jgi:nucleotide-binding universal stress UspA family protein
MKIMIGVDDSPHSQAAVDFVKKMAWPKGSTIEVLSVVRPVAAVYSEAYVPAPAYVEEANEEMVRHHQETASNAERQLQGFGLGTQAKILHGDPRTELVDAARAAKADLLVLGSHGRTGMSKLLMGSVASYVVTHAPCSVMVVKLSETQARPAATPPRRG